MSISTKDINVGGGQPKTLQPGNQKLKVNNVVLEPNKFKDGSYYIILNMESEPISGFEGLLIDRDDESKGRYEGQIGKVKASQYSFEDGETKGGTIIKRDESMLKFLKKLCLALGIGQWLDDQDGKHDTVESIFEAFNKDRPFAGIYIEYCVAGKEYVKNNYTNYELFLPNGSKEGNPFGTKLLTFDESKHIVKKKAADTVSEFAADNSDVPTDVKDDFQID